MRKIFKNMIPYWKYVLAIFVLLVIQVYGDLALPSYTSNIIDVGITSQGVEHILPEQMTAEDYKSAQLFMTSEEKEAFTSLYTEQTDALYVRTDLDEDSLEAYDEQFLIPIVMTYQVQSMLDSEASGESSSFTLPGQLGAETGSQAEGETDAGTASEDGAEGEKDAGTAGEDGAEGETDAGTAGETELAGNAAISSDMDLTQMMKLLELGLIPDSVITQIREQVQTQADSIGSSTLLSMGKAYAAKTEEAAGIDLEKKQMNYMWSTGAKMLGIALIMMLCSIGVGYLAARVGAGVGRDLRARTFRNVVEYSNTEMDQFSTASLITRSTNDIQQIQQVTTLFLRMLLMAPIMGIGGVIKVAQTASGMEWIIAVAVAVMIGFVLLLGGVAMPKFKIMQTLVDKVNLVSREILTGLSVIRSFGREKWEEERFDQANKELTKTQLFTNRVMTLMMPGMMMIMYVVTLSIVWVASKRIDSGVMQVGQMTAFITYTMMIVMAFLMLTMMSIMMPRAGVAAERVDEVTRTFSSIKEPEHPYIPKQKRGELTFEHVSFRYPGAKEDVLSDIDFTVQPGTTTAIIGSTGSGKSTMVNLIPRFYDVTDGRILLDGHDVRDYSLQDLRDSVGFVQQKGVLFSGTIASNLRFGRADASAEELAEAAQIAQAEDFIEEKERKYDSHIAQGGSNVSGGQKQRLAIARAVVKNPAVYVFDDSFSALDMKTDAKLRKALAGRTEHAATIIVAQRISTILHADQILVLEEGRIVGKGTHEELLRSCEVYEQIARSQLSAKELGLEEADHEKEGKNNG